MEEHRELIGLARDIAGKYGIDVKVKLVDLDSLLVMKSVGRDIILVNKRYLDWIRDPDIMRALLYHEVGHLINHEKAARYFRICVLGAILIGIGISVGVLGRIYTRSVIPIILFPFIVLAGLILIRASMRANEAVADDFAAGELGREYYLGQLEKWMKYKGSRTDSGWNHRAQVLAARILGYPTIEYRVKRLRRSHR